MSMYIIQTPPFLNATTRMLLSNWRTELCNVVKDIEKFKMANFGTKTPVSILNEYALKRGSLPKFDLIMSERGMSAPLFAYAVHFEHYVAVGKGRSKQEAKHQAARKMLEELDIPCKDEHEKDVTLVVPHENHIGYNAVGGLAEFCGRMCYPEPVYEQISEVGRPHEKLFTIKCSVSKLNTVGEARTKKEAKLIAAHKMLRQLQLDAGENPMAVALPKKPGPVLSAITELPRATPVYVPHVQLYKDFCNAYLGLEEKSETLTNIFKDWGCVTLKNASKSVHDIANELAVLVSIEKAGKYTYCQLPGSVLEMDYINEEGDKNSDHCIFITLELHPPVVSLGKDVPSAALNLLETLKTFCT